jgi:hemerythrin-like domain-containing protein
MHTPTQPHDRDRLTAYGNQLVEIHIWLREELARLRESVESHLEGVGSVQGRSLDLRAHCLTFCGALSRHHTDEDAGTFPVLAAQFPQLRPVVEELMRDHHLVAGILGRLEELLSGLDAGPVDQQGLRAELDGLAALLESHFVYEEKKLVAALNSLSA